MRRTLLLFFLWLATFAVGKVTFIAVCATEEVSTGDVADILRHGLPMDLAMTAYLIAVPLLLGIVAVAWQRASLRGSLLRHLLALYNFVAAAAIVIAVIADIALYPFWGFKLDATVLNYIDSPANAVNSVSVGFVATLLGIAASLTAALTWMANSVAKATLTPLDADAPKPRRIAAIVLRTIVLIALFPVMRGGVTESTMNVGNAYFSDRTFLNHAAVNPLFSFLYSLGKNDHFERLYRAMPDDEAVAIVDSLYKAPTHSILDREGQEGGPYSVLIIIWEGGGGGCRWGGGDDTWTPCLDSIAAANVAFTNLRATSFRTDRGVLSILSGHPAYPTHSLMKMAARASRLPSMARSLQRMGYTTHFTYGGDINFTNMKGYLLATGFQHVTADSDFDMEARQTAKWGVCDSLLFERLMRQLAEHPQPWFHAALTLSSHEPWDVPGHDGALPSLEQQRHAFRYADRQIGRFLQQLRATPLWDNLLVIILPDHGLMTDDTSLEDPRFYRIPMVWTGGAVEKGTVVKEKNDISVLMSQSDVAATVLARLGVAHNDFPWSRDVLAEDYTCRCTYSSFNDGFVFTDSTGVTVYDNKAGRAVVNTSTDGNARRRERYGLAIQQVTYDALR